MTHPRQPSRKRSPKAMCRERAPEITGNRPENPPESPPAKHLPRNIESSPSKPPHPLWPIAVRLATGFPPSGWKGGSQPLTSRKARQIRRKSETHKANRLPS
jgi:hypothetical protein